MFDFRERVLFNKSGAIAHCGEHLSRDNIHNKLYWLSSFRLNSFLIHVQYPKTNRARQRFFKKFTQPTAVKCQTVCQPHRYHSNRIFKSLIKCFSCLPRASLRLRRRQSVISRETVNVTWNTFYHDIFRDAK